MQLLRTLVVFLVGAGIAIGAHFAGWLNDLPRYLRSATYGSSTYDSPSTYDAAAVDSRGREIAIPAGAEDAPPPLTEEDRRQPTAIRVYYAPSRGYGGEAECPPDYVVLNRTRDAVLFSEADGFSEAGGRERYDARGEAARDFRIDPGASLSPSEVGPQYAEAGRRDAEPVESPCRSGTVRIVMEGE